MRKMTFSLFAAALTLGIANHARADSVLFTGFAGGSQSVHYQLLAPNAATSGNANAGGFATVLNGGPSFVTYCVDLYERINFGTTYTNYTGPNTSHVFANASAHADLGRLYANVGTLSGAAQQAAFQIAVWEIAYETSGTYSLLGGAALFSGAPAGTLTQAQNWLTGLGSGTGLNILSLDSVTLGRTVGHQDVIYAAPIPEPETYALLMAGLGALGFVARRRRK